MYQEIRIPRLGASLWRFVPTIPRGDASTGTHGDASTGTHGDASAELLSDGSAQSLIVPDGCMDLIVLDAEVVVAGADSTARAHRGVPQPTVGLRFDPGVLPQLLATSAAELANTITPLDAVVPGSARMIASRSPIPAFSAPVPGPRIPAGEPDGLPPKQYLELGSEQSARTLLGIASALLAQTTLDLRPMAIASRLRPAQPSVPAVFGPDPIAEVPAQPSTAEVPAPPSIAEMPAPPSIAEVAAQFAYSPRQLRRLAADWFGYGPKHLAKILRWQAANRLITAGQTRTAAAAAVGYSDAAHLWRDEKALLGR